MGVTLCRSNSLRRWPESGGAPCPESHSARSWPPGWLFPELQGGGHLPFLEADAYTAQGPGTRPRPFWGLHGGKWSPTALVEPRGQMRLLPKECAGPISAVSLDFSSVSIVMRGVDFDCQKHLFPLCFLKAAWVLVLCLGSMPETSEFCCASRKGAYVCTPFSLLSLEGPALDLLELQEKSFVFFLLIFESTRAASFWIYECQRFFF